MSNEIDPVQLRENLANVKKGIAKALTKSQRKHESTDEEEFEERFRLEADAIEPLESATKDVNQALSGLKDGRLTLEDAHKEWEDLAEVLKGAHAVIDDV